MATALFLSAFGGCQATRNAASHTVASFPWVHSNQAISQTSPASEKTVRSRGLTLSLRLHPVPIKLSETRRIEMTLRLENVSSRFIPLEFPTSQRFDVLMRDATGRVVAQWSEDRVFETVPGYVGINPGEHLDYDATLSTRDMQPGKKYTLTAIFPSRTDLKVELSLVPEK